VVVEDTAVTRMMLRYCHMADGLLYTTFDCPGEATYLLTRNCTEQYYVAIGICCKVDSALDYLIYDNLELYKKIEYAFVIDDDEFIRLDQLFRWIYLLDDANINTLPIVGNSYGGSNADGGVWHQKRCSNVHTMGWYQPMMLNKKAIEVVSTSIKAQGITQTCLAFEASQDVSIGVWAWQHELYHIHIPRSRSPGHGELKNMDPRSVFVHGIRHSKSDKCDGGEEEEWKQTRIRYNQTIMVGCGSIDQAVPTHDRNRHMDMYDVWNYYAVNGSDISFYKNYEDDLSDWTRVNGHWNLDITKLEGYNKTDHYQKYKSSGEWKSFSPRDCHG
jgi:hypothetical protein